MKKKIYFIAAAAFLCACFGCSAKPEPKKLVITNITGISGDFVVQLAGDTTGNNADAEGMGTIQGASVSVDLYKTGTEDVLTVLWTGTGNYYVAILMSDHSAAYVSKNPIAFNKDVTTVSFEDFKEL